MERLQKIIAASGYCSRRRAEELIGEGRVSLNGIQVTSLGVKADEGDQIAIDGVLIGQKEEKAVYLLNKPRSVISSASDDRGRKTVVDLIDTPYRLYPLGRLDYDSSGLILLSNDGELMQKLIHPSFEVDKVYEVVIDGLIKNEEIGKLERGVKIEDYVSAPAKVSLISVNENKKTSFLEVTIHEGKNREIRKMFESLGYKVIRLHRIKEAGIELGDLKSGEYRRLKPYEVKKLKAYLNGKDL
ncbi:MAG: rRNA pseudouridine synthase [Erysipelotrichaceae bacterium]|nr:rRNA pseudouridine synthase [Erysipelotrichaceae bacterium]